MLSATWLAQSCYALVKLGVPDLLAGGPRTAEDLAVATGADPHALRRLLRALASAGLLKQPAPGTYALGPVTELLRSDAPGSAHLTALMYGEEIFRSFAEIEYTVRTGRPAFEKVHGQPFYAYLDANPDAAYTFHTAMGDQSVPAVLSTCDLAGVRTIVDVGGGNGSLLAAVLAEYPQMRGVLADLPDAVRHARTRLRERVDFVEGSFFAHVPAGGDAYVLCRVLHNWTDERAVALLRRVRAAMAPGARLIVLEEFLPEDATAGSATAGMVDLLMLVTLEGHDRTEAEYRALLGKAGFDVLAARPGAGPGTEGVIEATAGGDEA